MGETKTPLPEIVSRDEWLYGRQEDWDDSPAGWPRGPRYSWWRHHDKYDL